MIRDCEVAVLAVTITFLRASSLGTAYMRLPSNATVLLGASAYLKLMS